MSAAAWRTTAPCAAVSVAAFEQGDNYLDRYSRDKQVYYGIVEADLGESTTLAVGASHQRNRPEGVLWGALPLFYSDGTPTDYDVSTSTAADWSHWDTGFHARVRRTAARLRRRMAGEGLVQLRGERRELGTVLRLRHAGSRNGPGSVLVSVGLCLDVSRALTSTSSRAGPSTLFGRKHDVVVGGNWARGDVREISQYSDDLGTALPPLDVFDGHYPKPAWNAPSDGSDFDFTRESVYATVRWDLADSVKLITGASRTHAETYGDSYGVPNSADETDTTPFAGLVVDLAPNYSLYGSYGEIFNPQSELDVDHQFVGALTGSNAEVGLKGAWKDDAINASIAVFRARQDNLAEFAGFDPDTFASYLRRRPTPNRAASNSTWPAASTISGRCRAACTHLRLVDGRWRRTRRRTCRARRSASPPRCDIPQVEGLMFGGSVRWQSGIHRDVVLPDGSQRASNRTPTPSSA